MELKFNVSEKIQCGVANKLGGRVFFFFKSDSDIYLYRISTVSHLNKLFELCFLQQKYGFS